MQQFSGLEYIKIDIANQFGHDKLTWDQRIDFVDQNINQLEALEASANDPILYAKAVRALADAHNGAATGYMVGLDATASGIQIMAALQGCKTTACAVNLIPTGIREDVYQSVADQMTERTGRPLDKATVKKPVMTTFYGSKKQPEEVFGEDTTELRAFYKTLDDMLPGAMDCMNDIQGCWQSGAHLHKWTLPDGHVASVKVMQSVDKKIEVDELNHATFTHRAYVNQGTDTGLSLAANVVHSIDGFIVREQVRRSDRLGYKLPTIHDSFWAHPNFMNEVRQGYLTTMMEIAESSLLEDILNEITGSTGKLTKLSHDLAYHMTDSNYALS
jgi:DNA-directed RNA polymerase